MNQNQRDKLSEVLIAEALTCSERGDVDDALALQRQSVSIKFRDEIEDIIKGDFALLDVFQDMQHEKDKARSTVARVVLHLLVQDERFHKMYERTFKEEENNS